MRESSGALAFTLGDGKYTGFHYDVCAHIIADIQKQLGLAKLETKYQPVTSQNRIPLVQNGTVDLECGSTTNNATRQKDVAFAPTLYVEEVRIAVKASCGIKDIAGLNGKTVATTTGTTSVQLLRKNKRAAGMDFKELNGKDHSDSFLLLESGRADAFVMDGQILAGLISKVEEPGRLQDRRRAALGRADRDHVSQGRSGVQEGWSTTACARWPRAARSPSCTTSGSCSRSRRRNTKVGLPASEATKAAWANPTDKPLEDYAQP